MDDNIFEGLFVLEMANNHLGNVERGLNIINSYEEVIKANKVRAAIKLQFRDVDNFIHTDFQDNNDIRYIQKTRTTKLKVTEYETLVNAIQKIGCMPMATPFDEKSVTLCEMFELPIIKIASSCINDWSLIKCIAKTKIPVIVSTGGASLHDIDVIVDYFKHRKIPIAINHCVSIYPSEDSELELNQIDFLKNRFSHHVIGFSSHEYHDWSASMYIAYAKGARTFERHIDIKTDEMIVSPYCSLPEQIDTWFKAYNHARLMCGGTAEYLRHLPEKEVRYLDNLVRGLYARRDLNPGDVLQADDFYAAIPLQAGQISCRELDVQHVLQNSIKANQPIMLTDLHDIENDALRNLIQDRGLKYAL